MTDGARTLTADEIRAALGRLGELASGAGEEIHLVALGGVVMVLAYGHRESTRDVDAVFRRPRPTAPIRRWAIRVAQEHSLPIDWLNDGVKGYVGEAPPEGVEIFSAVGITVVAARPEVMLGSKLAAFRDVVDRSDARRILEDLAGSKIEVWQRIEPYVQPPAALTKACYAFDELWDEIRGDD